MIRLDQGGWALLAHLQQGSILVGPGARVEVGAFIARVGNSGRSPIPHVHLQCQPTADPSEPTMPFQLANFLSAPDISQPFQHWHSAAMPSQGSLVSPAPANPAVQLLLASAAPVSIIRMVCGRRTASRIVSVAFRAPAEPERPKR